MVLAPPIGAYASLVAVVARPAKFLPNDLLAPDHHDRCGRSHLAYALARYVLEDDDATYSRWELLVGNGLPLLHVEDVLRRIVNNGRHLTLGRPTRLIFIWASPARRRLPRRELGLLDALELMLQRRHHSLSEIVARTVSLRAARKTEPREGEARDRSQVISSTGDGVLLHVLCGRQRAPEAMLAPSERDAIEWNASHGQGRHVPEIVKAIHREKFVLLGFFEQQVDL
jgi:hypothetical protein